MSDKYNDVIIIAILKYIIYDIIIFVNLIYFLHFFSSHFTYKSYIHQLKSCIICTHVHILTKYDYSMYTVYIYIYILYFIQAIRAYVIIICKLSNDI